MSEPDNILTKLWIRVFGVDSLDTSVKLRKSELLYFEGALTGVYGNWLLNWLSVVNFDNIPIWLYLLRIILLTSSSVLFLLFFLIGDRVRSDRLYGFIGLGHIVALYLLRIPIISISDLAIFVNVGFVVWSLIMFTKRKRKEAIF